MEPPVSPAAPTNRTLVFDMMAGDHNLGLLRDEYESGREMGGTGRMVGGGEEDKEGIGEGNRASRL